MHRTAFAICSLTFAAALLAAVALAAGQAEAADASCKGLFKLKSKNSNTPTTITFINNAQTVRGILWLDFDGHPKDYATLNPGQSATRPIPG